MRGLRLWQRDDDIIRELTRSPLLTSLVALLFGFSRKKAAERLYLLYKAGLLQRVPYWHPGKQARPEFVYAVSMSQLRQRTLLHTIRIATVRVRIACWLQTSGWTGEFFYTHELQTTGAIIPDLTVIIRKGAKSGLFYFEIDNGTENVTSAAGYSIAKKLGLYAEHYDSEGYARDLAWAGAFRGFRVCLLIPTGRQKHVQHLIRQEQHDFVLTSTFDLLGQGMDRPIWKTFEGVLVDLLGRGEVVRDFVGEVVEPQLPSSIAHNTRNTNEFRSEAKSEIPSRGTDEGGS